MLEAQRNIPLLMPITYLGLGSNSTDQIEMLLRARILVNIYMGLVLKTSQVYHTSPWGYPDQEDFANQVVKISTTLAPDDLHKALLKVEKVLEKHKTTKYGPRNIDIDILMYDDLVLDENQLKIPLPRMHERNFVLIPLAEIAPSYIHPVLNKTIVELAASCDDTGSVRPQESFC